MLQVARARPGDAGRYSCVAVNEAGQDSIHYDIRVLCELPFSSECQKGFCAKQLTIVVQESLVVLMFICKLRC